MTLYIFRGLPGSSKSTIARKMQREIGGRVVERDNIRYELYGTYFDPSRVDEKVVTEEQNERIDRGLRYGENVFVSDMNLRNSYVTRLIEKAQKHEVAWEIVDLTNVDLDTCIYNDKGRGEKQVGVRVINDLHTRFIKGKPYPLPVTFKATDAIPEFEKAKRQVYVPDTSKPDAIIVDIDGTVACMKDRGPFDEHLVSQDELIEPVAQMVLNAAYSGLSIVFMSGRTDGCREDTEEWLLEKLPWLEGFESFDVPWDLHMRRSVEDRGRPDDDVKYDLFMREVAPYYNVLYTIDDRDKVVAMWRSIGLVCAQVNYGAF